MKATQFRLLSVAALLGVIAALPPAALAQATHRNQVVHAQGATTSPQVISKSRQPTGKRQQASALAPRPTSKRVFGAPIQPPIMHSTAPKKPAPK